MLCARRLPLTRPAGQEPLRDLEAGLKAQNASVWCIGGADVATELDAKRAIDQGEPKRCSFDSAFYWRGQPRLIRDAGSRLAARL